jgi:ribosome modulation factor
MTKHEHRNKIWLEGYNAMWAGAKMEACPYEDESDNSETWFEGYTWAIEEKYDGGREPQ